jgi:hypothetical protein
MIINHWISNTVASPLLLTLELTFIDTDEGNPMVRVVPHS